ncbi:MAG: ATP-binding cassette domain-containing protein [Burkholderiales bacterium]|nr:ATP-binding cassette domain-containing protein [Burkholderiales bacterium]
MALLGTNGAGKTTLMRAITGLHRPISGRVLLLGERIQSLAAYRIAREGLALVPEGRQVFPELSVADNIALGCRPNASSDATVEVERLLERFSQLKPLRDKRAGLLSGASSRCWRSRAGSPPGQPSCSWTSRRWASRPRS